MVNEKKRKRGKPGRVAAPRKRQITLRLPVEVFGFAEEIAEEKVCSLQTLLENYIQEGLEEAKKFRRWQKAFPFLPEEQSVSKKDKLEQLFMDLRRSGLSVHPVGPFWYVNENNIKEDGRVKDPLILDRKEDGLILTTGWSEDNVFEIGIPFSEQALVVKKFYGLGVDPTGGFYSPFIEATLEDCQAAKILKRDDFCFITRDRLVVQKVEGLGFRSTTDRQLLCFFLQKPGLLEGPSIFRKEESPDHPPPLEEDEIPDDFLESHSFPDEPEENED